MSSSLIPERLIVISPSVAATLGLEEACMLSLLSDMAAYSPLITGNTMNWLNLDSTLISRLMPFWTEHDIQRISKNLADKGVIILNSAPYLESHCLNFAFNETKSHKTETKSRKSNIGRGANLIDPFWQPDEELLKKIAEHNIPEYFIRQEIPEFVTYWRERGETSHSWGAKFMHDLLHKWRNQQTQTARQQRDSETDFIKRDQDIAMHTEWRPSQDALEVLVKHANISLAFVEDAIPEFVLYWQERGDVGKTWNSKFIQHVKRQWTRYNSALEHDTEPRRIPENWQPSNDLFDVLRLANINKEFAQRQVAEFLLFWRDSNQIYASWNTKFLQHVKFHWAKQHALTTMASSAANISSAGNRHAGQQPTHSTNSTRTRSLIEDLTDRSWAR
jgi:polyhydroxyalkanoate synthesis regulator phasin